MKNIATFCLILLFFSSGFSQTAVNFSCDDCAGANHDLFTHLDTGKVVVICWVMPCVSCVGPALTTYNVVKSFDQTHPGRVAMFMVDDYANTPCVSLRAWAFNYGISDVTFFSHSAISMMDYGGEGMPKIVVVAGSHHRVYYNANNSVDGVILRDSIAAALNAPVAAISEVDAVLQALRVFPNPTRNSLSLGFSLLKSSVLEIAVMDIHGRTVLEVMPQPYSAGEHQVSLQAEKIGTGVFFIRIQDGMNSHTLRAVLSR